MLPFGFENRVVTRIAQGFGWALVTLLVLLWLAWLAARPATPNSFYEAPRQIPAKPGTLLRQQPFARGIPVGAIAWRILYTTIDQRGPVVASALVVAPINNTAKARPIIAWAHGTTGVVPGCAPSLLEDPFANVPAFQDVIRQGWIYVAADYIGQGTRGPNPYLIGKGEARSVLDAVRAARQMKELVANDQTVVWGHSQGGNAALWTAIEAPTYAPDVPISGVAALAPATDLRSLVEIMQHVPVGRIMSSFILQAYSERYPEVRFDTYAAGWSRILARDMASRCLAGRSALFSVVEALALGKTIFSLPPLKGPLGARLRENTPDHAISQPLLIAQGLSDDLVLPEIQGRFIRGRCAAAQALEFLRYTGRDHLSLVAGDSPLTADLVTWTAARLGGVAAPRGCHEITR